jgi:ABC-type Fe3+-hydroxamate transport system substrate-binding protein
MMQQFTDMMGRQVDIPFPPKRIVSVVPSQTELLYDLGLHEEVVGITKFCIHPDSWFRTKTRVGGTKQLNIEKIHELHPDLIIANKEENTKEQIEQLAAHYPVWISDIHNLPQALDMIRQVGTVVNRAEKAENLAQQIEQGFAGLHKATINKRVAYFIWYRPWMSAGRDTFIHSIIKAIGWENALSDKTRYPEVTLEELAVYNPDTILLSSEPFPFKEKHIAEIKAVLPLADVRLVDGEMFSWYGSRLLKAVDYLKIIIANP